VCLCQQSFPLIKHLAVNLDCLKVIKELANHKENLKVIYFWGIYFCLFHFVIEKTSNVFRTPKVYPNLSQLFYVVYNSIYENNNLHQHFKKSK